MSGAGWQGGIDESWALENVAVVLHGLPDCNPTFQQIGKSGPGTELWWSGGTPGEPHDVVKGDLGTLLTTGGDFTAALDALPSLDVCLDNDNVSEMLIDTTPDPPVGEGWFYIVRCDANTWDSLGTGQTETRDSEIFASGADCP